MLGTNQSSGCLLSRSIFAQNMVGHKWSSGRTIGYQAHTERRFARLLLIVLPCSLFLTWIWKQEASHFAIPSVEVDVPSAYLYGGRTVFYPPTPVEPRCSESQRDTLRQVGTSLAVKEWGNRSAWREDDCCSWDGVSCSPRGDVQKLELHALSGTLPPELARLPSLKVLDCNKNGALSGTLPSQALYAVRVGTITSASLTPLPQAPRTVVPTITREGVIPQCQHHT